MQNYVEGLDTSSPAPEGAYADIALGGLRKRTFDIAVASVLLVVLAPMLLATAGLIRLMIGKSAIVIKQWVGFGGKVFDGYEFRTVMGSCEDRSSALRRSDHAWGAILASALQSSGTDKLPLLLNVLRGDMSLVGPRPIVVGAFTRYPNRRSVFYTARPGLTGVWRHSRTLNLKRAATPRALDRYYVRYWSMWFDLVLLIQLISRGA